MIDIRDLRIGNIISSEETNYTIHGMSGKYVVIDDYGENINVEELEPIKLTEDILNSCKLNKDYVGARLLSDKIIVYPDIIKMSDEYMVLFSAELNIKSTFLFKIKYLHELQNVYYDINKKELEVDL